MTIFGDLLFFLLTLATACHGLQTPNGLVAKFAITSIDVTQDSDHDNNDDQPRQVQFDGGIRTSVKDGDAVLLKDIKQVGTRQAGALFWKREVPVFTATVVKNAEDFVRAIQAEVDSDPKCRGVLLYIHGFNMQPEDTFAEVRDFHDTQQEQDLAARSLCIPVLWPTDGSYFQDKRHVARQAARGLESLVQVMQKIKKESTVKRSDISWGLLAHSMGNFLLRKIALRNDGDQPLVSQIFMVAADIAQDTFEENPRLIMPREVKNGEKGKKKDHPGVAIVNLLEDPGSGGRVHVLWTRRDSALFVRRWNNLFVKALGREGVERESLKAEFRGTTPANDTVVALNCDEHSEKDPAYFHSYQFAPRLVEYFNSALHGK